ncbi:phosphatidate cytidylyltransferase [Ichthyobacterium seriolicida]|uniref:Phosphatidate cytidylyltransferase n=1 Tax=Ichthyobacterium seriolicida TaxID=242600 RepID=A0A1J1DW45_9FLAO|nr:phosphatidate cytidylyltransferase [Ichthyobacterium seriolicida]BAV94087.1 phosphatidate cytidylyltransferase [Ichthyobacterium seriolicida]
MSNDFLKRTITGIVFVSISYFCVVYSKYSLYFFLVAMSLIGNYEFYKMTKMSKIGWAFTNVFTVLLFLYIIDKNRYLELAIIFFLFINFLIPLFRKSIENPFDYLGKIFISTIYVTLPLLLIFEVIQIELSKEHNKIILSIFILIWSNDSFAYLIGKYFGKKKLFKKLSPQKTLEGFLGGIFFSYLISYFMYIFWINNKLTITLWFILVSIIVVTSIFGDLIESMLKRFAQTKDSGRILPGHGGILDRIDSFLFVCPFVYLFFKLIYHDT